MAGRIRAQQALQGSGVGVPRDFQARVGQCFAASMQPGPLGLPPLHLNVAIALMDSSGQHLRQVIMVVDRWVGAFVVVGVDGAELDDVGPCLLH